MNHNTDLLALCDQIIRDVEADGPTNDEIRLALFQLKQAVEAQRREAKSTS